MTSPHGYRAAMLERQNKANSKLLSAEIEQQCPLDDAAAAILQRAIAKLGLSARGYHRILKVARTIADLAGAVRITSTHVAEAVQYRGLERAQW